MFANCYRQLCTINKNVRKIKFFSKENVAALCKLQVCRNRNSVENRSINEKMCASVFRMEILMHKAVFLRKFSANYWKTIS